MIRAQLLLDPETHAALRRKAFEEHRSVSDVAREILGRALRPPQRRRRRGAGPPFGFTFIGLGRSGRSDVAERHDDYLGERTRW